MKKSIVKQPKANKVTVGGYNSIAMPLVRRVFPELFANTLVGVVPNSTSAQNNAELDEMAKMCRKLLDNQWNLERRQRKKSGWILNPAKEKKRIYHK